MTFFCLWAKQSSRPKKVASLGLRTMGVVVDDDFVVVVVVVVVVAVAVVV